MGGVNIDENIVIDKIIHKSINSPSAVLKVSDILPNFVYFPTFYPLSI